MLIDYEFIINKEKYIILMYKIMIRGWSCKNF